MPEADRISSAPKAPPGVTREAVKRLHRKGMPARRIAATLDVSTQIVYVHLRALEAEEAGR